MNSVFDKLDSLLRRYEEIEETMARPEVATDFEQVQILAKERASLEGLVDISRKHHKLAVERIDLETLAQEESDQELARMAKEELDSVDERLDQLSQELRMALLPKDPNDDRTMSFACAYWGRKWFRCLRAARRSRTPSTRPSETG